MSAEVNECADSLLNDFRMFAKKKEATQHEIEKAQDKLKKMQENINKSSTMLKNRESAMQHNDYGKIKLLKESVAELIETYKSG